MRVPEKFASLRLFNAVVNNKNQNTNSNSYHMDMTRGVFVHPSAMHEINVIQQYLEANILTGDDMNKSFYKTWEKVRNVSLEQRLTDQITHYLSTYGMESIGLYDPAYIYLPIEEGDNAANPHVLNILVIKGVSSDELIEKCFSMLNSGVALKQETIEDIIYVLLECGYKTRNFAYENIKNKEAACIVYDTLNILPEDGTELLRYFVYKATESTLVIKNKQTIENIKQSGYRLPSLTSTQYANLAGNFNRTKPLMLAFKKSHPDNRSIINEISRMSKSCHIPLPVNVLNTLTSIQHSDDAIRKSSKDANIYQLVRTINALAMYSENTQYRDYKIRNGKSWLVEKNIPTKVVSKNAFPILLEELENRIDMEKVFYIPEGIDYVIPTSEKQFLGNIPLGSSIEISPKQLKDDQFMMFGIYWEGSCVDLDLSGITLDGVKIGWNSGWRNNNKSVMYSGDVTSAPSGAAEWLYFNGNLEHPFLLVVNGYRAEENQKFKVVAAINTEVDNANTGLVDPNTVVFSIDNNLTKRQVYCGLVEPLKNGNIKFTIINSPTQNKRVSSGEALETIAIKTSILKAKTALTIRNICNVVNSKDEKYDVDLSPNMLTRDSLMSIFKS